MIVVSKMTHQYTLALRRQVLHNGGTKTRAQRYKLALRQRVKQPMLPNNNFIKETDEVLVIKRKQTKSTYNLTHTHTHIHTHTHTHKNRL